MGRINVAGWGLMFGAVGQAVLLHTRFSKVPFWMFYVPLFTPWLLVYTISFCRVAPCGPRRFAQILMLSMVWYSINTLLSELSWLFVRTAPSPVFLVVLPHALIAIGACSFFVLVPAVRMAREHEKAGNL